MFVTIVLENMQYIIAQQIKQTNQAIKQGQNQPAQIKRLSVSEIMEMATTQTNNQINMLLNSGVIKQQGELYTVDIQFAQGKLMVNGKPFTPDMLKKPKNSKL